MPNFRGQTRLVLFPGLAADGRLFEPQRRALEPAGVTVEVPPWLEPADRRETLEAYSARMAKLIEPATGGERLFLGGVSFGALVALEAARQVANVRGVFMMGGCRDTRAVSPFFRFACRLAPLMPTPLFKLVLFGGPAGLVMFESLSYEHMRLYTTMINDASPRQVQWAAGSLLPYRSRGDPPGVRVRLIHGSRDLLISPKDVKADYLIPRGRHLVSLTRPDAVNRVLLAEMTAAAAA